jgi:hypothetical protein
MAQLDDVVECAMLFGANLVDDQLMRQSFKLWSQEGSYMKHQDQCFIHDVCARSGNHIVFISGFLLSSRMIIHHGKTILTGLGKSS